MRNKNIYKTIDSISYIFVLLMTIVIIVNISERNEDVDDYLQYLSVIPVKIDYKENENFRFYSFVISHKPADTEWIENVWCANQIDGNFQEIPFIFNSISENYQSNNRYPEYIINLLSKDDYNSLETESILREYAKNNEVKGWTLNINKPKLNSVCVTEHTIIIHTTFFNFRKSTTIMSTPFTYGSRSRI